MERERLPLPDHVVTHDAGRTTVYLLHGIYGAKEYWRPLTRRLVEAGYRVIAWDAPGYGLSKRPDDFSFDVVAEAGARLIRATGTEHNVVFGHSMGGQITPRLVGKVADRVRAAVITATIGYFANRTPEEQAEFVRTRTKPPEPGTDPKVAQLAVINGMFAAGATGADVDLVREVAMQTPPDSVQASVRAVQAYPEQDAVGAFRALAVPTLLVAGSEDKVGHPEGMRRVAAMAARSEFAVVSRSGHYPWAENTAEFTPLLLDFLRRHAPAG
ncbi:alpha/beta hydrolase [Ramlibacter henchirensis]|uniref:Alpha/beta hydrolase n=1 Tax=Ramlibacter henchirensis TaxID=204072 RepID=A0A4Z0BX42_9BURK|nr:alpha/beta hydrolase [Ramlibacter henchirensis]TFZ02585.1 alpha/beta hydrolase [Ramlibacter henchirensis]